MKLIVDCYPLINVNYTGIPQTTWHVAKRLNEMPAVDCLFTIGYRVLDASDLSRLITERSGKQWRRLIRSEGHRSWRFLSIDDLHDRTYFAPHVMSIKERAGRGSVRMIHDISSITMPEFHPRDTVELDGQALAEEGQVCDAVITVSESSKQEIVSYLSVPADRVRVIYPGVSWSLEQYRALSNVRFDRPYCLVLATWEPRKNLALVFEYINENFERFRDGKMKFVFAGPRGWGDGSDLDQWPKARELANLGVLEIIGFVPETFKLALFANARYTLFPSFFEGFGSPVAESLSVGTPVVCSYGGSLPEVAGDCGYYFDPTSVRSMSAAIARVESDLSVNEGAVRSKSLARGEAYSWDVFAGTLCSVLASVYEGS